MNKRNVQHQEEHRAFCGYLRKLRKTYGYTQSQVAAALNLSRPQYSALETGRSMLTFDHLCGLARHYRFELFELIAERY